jgi:hypothetical protein
MAPFGYSPTRATQIKDGLDVNMAKIEDRAGRIRFAVPDAGSITGRVDNLLEELREVVHDLQDLVDRRTDGDAK